MKQQQGTLHPHLDRLAPAQRDLWPVLSQVPRDCILYGDTALSLRLDHAPAPPSFEFKTARSFLPHDLVAKTPFLQGAKFLESGPNFLKAQIETLRGPVDLTFEGDCKLREIQAPERTPNNRLAVASLPDLAAVKIIDLPQRDHVRDYQDVAELINKGISVEQMTSDATAITRGKFGKEQATAAVKALTDFSGRKVNAIPESTKELLSYAAVQAGARSYTTRLHSENLSMGLGIDRTPQAHLTNQRPSLKLDLNKEIDHGHERGE